MLCNGRNLEDLFGEEAQVPSEVLSSKKQSSGDVINGDKVHVYVRIRPSRGTRDEEVKDSLESGGACIQADSGNYGRLYIEAPPESQAYKNGEQRRQWFDFSRVFDDRTSQEEYYKSTIESLMKGLVDCGDRAKQELVILAYGITAAGKTYTMEGSKENPGLIPQALETLFGKIEEMGSGTGHTVSVSHCEIYNDCVYDLLNEEGSRVNLKLKENQNGQVHVVGLSMHRVGSTEDACKMMRKGSRQRQKAETGLNFSSSRSHSIFSVYIDGIGRASFVDLAGSERVHRAKIAGMRLKEAVAINASLMTLGRCLQALRYNQQQQKLCDKKGGQPSLRVIPYRESKVTHMFRDALHGYGTVVLSINASANPADFDETVRVLKYGAAASQIVVMHNAEPPKRKVKSVIPFNLRPRKMICKKEKRRNQNKVLSRPPQQEKEINQIDSIPLSWKSPKLMGNHDEPENSGSEDVVVYDVKNSDDEVCKSIGAEIATMPKVSPIYEDNDKKTPFNGFTSNSEDGITPCQGTIASCTSLDQSRDFLRSEVTRLLAELQTAEEKLVTQEAEIREEVEKEMDQILSDMEESFKHRLKKEITLAEKRQAGPISQESVAELKKTIESQHSMISELQSTVDNYREEIDVLKKDIHTLQSEDATKNKPLVEVKALQLALEQEKENNCSLAAALSEALRSSVGGQSDKSIDPFSEQNDEFEMRLKQEITQLEANKAMEVEMSEILISRLRKENDALKRKLEAARSAIQSLSSPSRNLIMQDMLNCPTGQGKGPDGTPHEIALARARKAAIEEDIKIKKSSRFAKEERSRTARHLQIESQPDAFTPQSQKACHEEAKNGQYLSPLEPNPSNYSIDHQDGTSLESGEANESEIVLTEKRVTRRMAKELCMATASNHRSIAVEERKDAFDSTKKAPKRRKLLDTSKKRQRKPVKTAGTNTPRILGISNAKTKKTCNK